MKVGAKGQIGAPSAQEGASLPLPVPHKDDGGDGQGDEGPQEAETWLFARGRLDGRLRGRQRRGLHREGSGLFRDC